MGEAHFLNRDASMPLIQLWRRSMWFPDIDILQEGITEIRFPFRKDEEKRMREDNELYLLHGISCSRPRPFRMFTQAQLIESTLVHGARRFLSDPSDTRGRGRLLFNALLYIGEPSGTFHYPEVGRLYREWLVKPVGGGAANYFKLVARILSEQRDHASEPA